MDQLRRHVGDFEAAWDAMPASQQRVLVLRCSGLSIKEVGLQLGVTPNTVKEYAKSVMETMREAIGEADLLTLCWLYGYSRALRDIDERLARKQRGT